MFDLFHRWNPKQYTKEPIGKEDGSPRKRAEVFKDPFCKVLAALLCRFRWMCRRRKSHSTTKGSPTKKVAGSIWALPK